MRVKYFDRLDSLRLRQRPVYEPVETAIITREVRPGQTFVDIGAHIGYYTLLASTLVGAEGKVFAFEPDLLNREVLEKNVAAAGCRNVTVIPKAVSVKTGKADLYLNAKNTGDNRLYHPGAMWHKVQVQTTRLDDYFDGYEGAIDFIKCDAQGHELSILHGAEKIVERFPKIKLLMEYFPIGMKQNGDNPATFLEELRRLGFRIERPARTVIDACNPANGRHCNLFLRREG